MNATKKRLTKADRAIANAERLALLLVAAPPESDGPLAPPAFITDRRLAPALQFWRDHADQLVKLGTLERVDRFAFAMLCIYVGEFIGAEDDILANGYSVRVRTISGDKMPRRSPSIDRRDFAGKMILELSRSFGLTKLDRLNLSRLERGGSYVPAPSLFTDQPEPATDAGIDRLRDLVERRDQKLN